MDAKHAAVREAVQRAFGPSPKSPIPAEKVQEFVQAMDECFVRTMLSSSVGTALYSATLALVVVDSALNVVVWNDHVAKETGISFESIKGKPVLHPEILDSVSANTLEAACKQSLKGHTVQGTTLKLSRKGSEALSMVCNFSPIQLGSGPGVVMVAQDVSHLGSSQATNQGQFIVKMSHVQSPSPKRAGASTVGPRSSDST